MQFRIRSILIAVALLALLIALARWTVEYDSYNGTYATVIASSCFARCIGVRLLKHTALANSHVINWLIAGVGAAAGLMLVIAIKDINSIRVGNQFDQFFCLGLWTASWVEMIFWTGEWLYRPLFKAMSKDP